MSWADGRLCGFDIETTGGDHETARIIAVAMAFVGDEVPVDNVRLLVDPGVPVPAEATALHGITTERVRTEGIAPAEALQQVANRLDGAWGSKRPLIGFNIVSDLTVLDREMRRHLGRGLAVTGPVIDPHVIDRALDRRKGPRTLEATCEYYKIRHDGAHDALQDALAAARLAWRLAKRYPAKVGRLSADELHRQQIDWAGEWADRLTEYWLSRGEDKSFDGTWPLRPYTIADVTGYDQRVVEAIHQKVLRDWENKLRTDGPEGFRTQLHIVNDTRDAHPYFTSIRCLPHNVGYNDAFPIALMGALANAMAADRVVMAWEPMALALATRTLGSPPSNRPMRPERTLMLLDVVSGAATRLSKHPYTAGRGIREAHTFAWGKPETTHHVTEPLPEVIANMIGLWRDPARSPQDAFNWLSEFRRAGYEITDEIRPR